MAAQIIVVTYAIGIAVLLAFRRVTVRFLSLHPAITGPESLEAFKDLARTNMKAVFPFVAVLLVGIIFSQQLIRDDGMRGFMLAMLLNGLLFGASMSLRSVEKKTRELPCATPQLAEEYQRVSRAWLSDFWPDF